MFPVLYSTNEPVNFLGFLPPESGSVHADPDPGGISLCGSVRTLSWITEPTQSSFQKYTVLFSQSINQINKCYFNVERYYLKKRLSKKRFKPDINCSESKHIFTEIRYQQKFVCSH